MRRAVGLVAVFLLASIAGADPVVTSISPIEGPVTGGTVVTIRGTGFSNNCIICSPPFANPDVFFGSTRAKSVKFIDSTTLEAVTPPHLPHTVSIRVRQLDGSLRDGVLENGFTFTGDPQAAFDPILFPVFVPPTDGAFGSRFETTARVLNGSTRTEATLYGLDTNCYLFTPTTNPFDPIGLSVERELLTGCSTSFGRVFYLSKGSKLAASLRVKDVSRQERSHGVDVPVVKAEDFSQDQVVLLNVPVDPRFRHTLRVYSLKRDRVVVSIAVNGTGIGQLFLTPGRNLFEPSYGMFTDFPQDLPAGSTMQVRLVMGKLPDGTTHPETAPIWAMISVTNNETQEITTITPQP